MKQRMKKPSLGTFILILILIGILAYVLWQFLSPKLGYKSLSDLEQRIITNAKSATDDNFFWAFGFDISDFRIKVVEQVGNRIESYQVVADPTIIRLYQAGTGGVISENILSQLGSSAPKVNSWREIIQLATKASLTSEIIENAINQKINNALSLVGAGQSVSKNTIVNANLPVIFNFDRPRGNFLSSFIVPYIPFLLISLFGFWLFFRLSQNSQAGGGLFNPGKNQAIRIKSNKKFTDVAGNAEVKEEIAEFVDYLKNPKKYAAAGAKIPKGILLGGPPGTGKTLLAKATAGEANVPFFFISASNFVELYVGVGAKRVRELFKEARAESPAIIFIDELDAIGRSRGSGIGGGHDEREQTLNQLLVEMDGMVENSGILLIGATNRTDVLDPALLRPGRFDRSIIVGLPDIKEREEILKLHAKGKRISQNITLANIAKRTPGFSGAQLENVINEATLLSVREKTQVITGKQIDEAIDRVISGPAKKNRVITEDERTMVAYHEAGHAVVGIKLRSGVKVQKITIVPRGNTGGYNLMLPEHEKYNSTKSELLASIAAFMGGRAAEEIIYGKNEISTGAANDIEKATKIARRMVTEFGMSNLGPIQYEQDNSSPFLGRDYFKNASFSSQVGHEIDIEIREIISSSYKLAIATIQEHRLLLELIKDTLLEKETIVFEEIQQLEQTLKPLPKSTEIEEKQKVNTKDILEELMGSDFANNQEKSYENEDQNQNSLEAINYNIDDQDDDKNDSESKIDSSKEQ
ncbi:Cell division protein [Mesomycoplasma conjunctivae]|uniref:ATP-dependent zinc metalloprotease FtsH n=1 Tax=Mesomycoplasma conjunctivae (strain ATCC 25834 / NCTC 10147 / HRC/581) TaxID=572263 RepID=FTSH_MESCH|nr:ATP-dependent zinc metalloprotease FtsH [Mesomycoplasma conjunctivae]C5J6A7.1 RecName: Full=ATP-dependent zinc metalloprotease FtsH [Mesomycoplasma conjunctivae HRC/581]CAT04999.1 Cell division protein [Mesomycoplasma conjunctivae]